MTGPVPRCHARLGCESLEGREAPAVLYAVTADQRLLTFDSSAPGSLLGTVRITGLARAGDQITDIDVRPESGELYGRSGDGRLYRIDTLTGAATRLTGGLTAAGDAGFDFNPTTDRIRVINASGQNRSIDPNTGAVASVGPRAAYSAGDPFAGVRPRIVALGHTDSDPLVPSTQLFGIDDNLNTLVVSVGRPNGAQFDTVGSLGIDVAPAVGFDIDPNGRVGYATFRAPGGGNSSFFSVVNLNTGAASVIGPIGPGPRVLDIAVSRTQTSGGALPPTANPRSLGFATTSLAATFASVFAPPVSGGSFTVPSVTGGFTAVPTSPLAPGLSQPLNGPLIAPLGPGLAGQPITSLGNTSLSSAGTQFNTLGGVGSFVVSPPITFGTGTSFGFPF